MDKKLRKMIGSFFLLSLFVMGNVSAFNILGWLRNIPMFASLVPYSISCNSPSCSETVSASLDCRDLRDGYRSLITVSSSESFSSCSFSGPMDCSCSLVSSDGSGFQTEIACQNPSGEALTDLDWCDSEGKSDFTVAGSYDFTYTVNTESGCTNECSSGQNKCEGIYYYECELGGDGCYFWDLKGRLEGKCGVECDSYHDCPDGYICENWVCVPGETTTTTVSGDVTTTISDTSTTNTSTTTGNVYHGISVDPDDYCWDACWVEDYAWGECYGYNPSDDLNTWYQLGGVGAYDCKLFDRCFCYGNHVYDPNSGVVVTGSDGTEGTLDIVDNGDGTSTYVWNNPPQRTPTDCEETCRRAGFMYGGCTEAGFFGYLTDWTSDSAFIGEKGELGCSANLRCMCQESYSDVELEEYQSRFEVTKEFFNETTIIHDKTEDEVWDLISKYWKTLLVAVVVLLLLAFVN